MRVKVFARRCQKRLEVSNICRYEYTAFGGSQLQNLGIGESFELYLGIQGPHVVPTLGESITNRPPGDVGVE